MNKNNYQSFNSEDRQEFKVYKNNVLNFTLTEDYLRQILTNGGQLDAKKIIKNGVDFNLSELDISKILLRLDKVKDGCNGPLDLKSKGRIELRKHAYKDKSEKQIKDRGFSPTLSTLLEQVAYIIYHANKIEKAKIHFDDQHDSIPSLSFTLRAKLGNKIGRIAVSFNDEIFSPQGQEEEVFVVTILSFK